MKKYIISAVMSVIASVSFAQVATEFGILGQVEGLQTQNGQLVFNAIPSGEIKAGHGLWFAGVRMDGYIGNDTEDGSCGFFLTQMKVSAGRKIGGIALSLNAGQIRRQMAETSPWTMTGTAQSQNLSLAWGVLATVPKALSLELEGRNFAGFAGYCEEGEGGGTWFAGGNMRLFDKALFFSAGADVDAFRSLSGFGSARLKAGKFSLMAEGSHIGTCERNLIANANYSVGGGKYTIAAEGHFRKDFARTIVSLHTPQGIWVGAGCQSLAGKVSPVATVGITKFFSL